MDVFSVIKLIKVIVALPGDHLYYFSFQIGQCEKIIQNAQEQCYSCFIDNTFMIV